MNSIKRHVFAIITIAGLFALPACKKDKAPEPTGGIRKRIDYNSLSASTPYTKLFLDNNGDTLADLTIGNTRFRMFQALNYYLGAAVRDSKALDSVQMNNMFSNTGGAFSDVPSLKIVGANLNASGLSLSDVTASSSPADAAAVRKRIESLFGDMARLSVFFADTAAKGKPGKAGTYLADAKGIEVAQVIQKTLIGATQLDYIGNVLLGNGPDADNTNIIAGKRYTQCEQNWDEAYAFLTLNPVYLLGSTDAVRGTSESFLGSYIWEYNKADYAKVYPAFLKGRAAIANNDIKEAKDQASFIRTVMEKAIASAAVGYLNKWKTSTTDDARIHAIGEGLGFIYALRYCKLYGADAAFSDKVLNDLMNTPDGYWDLTATRINTAVNTISSRFGL